jgi:CTP:molybdopterin cytidylyltransferase MocA
VILAAGASTRLGEPKQLAMLGGERLLERAMRVAREAGCEPVAVVLGAGAERIELECRLGSARIVRNERWSEGMASSIRAGVAAVMDECDQVVVMACDQPAVTGDHLSQLMVQCEDAPAASGYAGRRGVPACFPADWFAALLRLQGDEGARELLASSVAVELAGGELDVDTAEALKTARASLKIRPGV